MKYYKPDVSLIDAMMNPAQWIPEGCYCHSGSYICPFWYLDGDMNGGCHYLKHDDNYYADRDYFTLLFDMVKECGINWSYDD